MTTTDARHPLVAAYLADLERALAGADPWERTDTMASVMDHIAESLAGDPAPGDDRVRAVLDGLGPVERIAASATPAPAAVTSEAGPAAAARSRTTTTLLVVLIAVLALPVLLPVAAFLAVALPWLGIPLWLVLLVVAAVRLRRGDPRRALWWTVAAVSAVLLVVTGVVGAGLMAFRTVEHSTVVETAVPVG